jgi:hypothetical protein
MAKLFAELRERLLRAGVAPRHVRRYLKELADHLADLKAEENRAGRNGADADEAALVRLGGVDELARAMTEKRKFQAWFARAPWAMFGFAPLLLLVGAYFVALLILWSGWRMFLPGAETPFVRLEGFAVIYFGVGRMLYYSAPVLIGWGIGLVAARQRFKLVWPAVGLVLTALLGGAMRVSTYRQAVYGNLGVSPREASSSLIHALVILAFTMVPYLIWRLRGADSLSA